MIIRVNLVYIVIFSIIIGCNDKKVNNTTNLNKESIKRTNYRDSLFQTMEAALEQPDSVFSLSLKEKKYKKIPIDIFKLKNLEYLNLSMNPIDSIPNKISKLKKLEVLILAYGNVQYIDPSICNLKHLKELNFLYNEIKELPICLSTLENLEVINFNGNQISKIPLDMHKLKKLKVFCIANEDKASLLNSKEKKYLKEKLGHCKIMF